MEIEQLQILRTSFQASHREPKSLQNTELGSMLKREQADLNRLKRRIDISKERAGESGRGSNLEFRTSESIPNQTKASYGPTSTEGPNTYSIINNVNSKVVREHAFLDEPDVEAPMFNETAFVSENGDVLDQELHKHAASVGETVL